jgi:hypothetical protein
MVDDAFRIGTEERERLVAEEVEEFPINTPKYTTYLLNPAINLSQSNRPEVVGQMSEIIDEFRTKHPDGTFEDWIEFYFEEYDGERRLEEATEKAVPMVKKMKEAFEQVDKDMTHNYLRDLVLFKTYEGFDIQETILRKLRDIYDAEIERATPDDESRGIDGYVDEQPVSIKPETYPDNLREEINAPIVYYDENKTNKAMTVDISELKSVMK